MEDFLFYLLAFLGILLMFISVINMWIIDTKNKKSEQKKSKSIHPCKVTDSWVNYFYLIPYLTWTTSLMVTYDISYSANGAGYE
ncbi:hypothetical protein AAEY33_12460 [Peribacillus simplex]|uniref:hypothetical protein n=1 Tax=Peribacillus simplex TaxID=1478 RepID=UPI003267B5A8